MDMEEVQPPLQRRAEPANVGGVLWPLTLSGAVRALGGRSRGPGTERAIPGHPDGTVCPE